MPRLFFILTTLVLLFTKVTANAQTDAAKYILPAPLRIHNADGTLPLSAAITCNIPDSLSFINQEIYTFYKKHFSSATYAKNKSKKTIIQFVHSDTLSNAEAYILAVKKKTILVNYKTRSGAFYAWQTLQQMLLYAIINKQQYLPCTYIYDRPRYAFRALMLDPARHFLPLDDLKDFIKTMAFYKYNTLHLHLTDDQGWRIQIKAYPQLTEKGSLVKQPDGSMKAMFYTQEQLRDLVTFARAHSVQLIPEIDIPGHNTALLVSFPELTCVQKDIRLRTGDGVSEDILCAGNPDVYTVYKKILTETAAIFPGEYFHLGGDEAPVTNWETCPKCQQLIKEKHLTDAHGLMAYFLSKNAAVVTALGKTPLFWYETDVPHYPANSIAYFWRMGLSQKVIAQTQQYHFPLIGAPGEYAYFDYPQSPNDAAPADWMPVTTLKQTYKFNPGYHFSEDTARRIIGVEATIWGEYVPNLKQACYQAYPRALAFAEAGWSAMQQRTWASFKERLLINLSFLLYKSINFRPPYEDF